MKNLYDLNFLKEILTDAQTNLKKEGNALSLSKIEDLSSSIFHLNNQTKASQKKVISDFLDSIESDEDILRVVKFSYTNVLKKKRLGFYAENIFSETEIDELVDILAIEDEFNPEEKTIYFSNKNDLKGKSLKISNIFIDYNKLSDLGVEIAEVLIGSINPIILVLKIIRLIEKFSKIIVIPLSEKEVSILWGIISLHNQKNPTFSCSNDLIDRINQERKKFGYLAQLSVSDVEDSLIKLEKIKIVKKLSLDNDLDWKLNEKIKIND